MVVFPYLNKLLIYPKNRINGTVYIIINNKKVNFLILT